MKTSMLSWIIKVLSKWKWQNEQVAVGYFIKEKGIEVVWVGKRKHKPTYHELVDLDIEWYEQDDESGLTGMIYFPPNVDEMIIHQ